MGQIVHSFTRNSLLAYLGLESVRTRPAQNLSGGMKRKLMIAKAMIHNPQYLK